MTRVHSTEGRGLSWLCYVVWQKGVNLSDGCLRPDTFHWGQEAELVMLCCQVVRCQSFWWVSMTRVRSAEGRRLSWLCCVVRRKDVNLSDGCLWPEHIPLVYCDKVWQWTRWQADQPTSARTRRPEDQPGYYALCYRRPLKRDYPRLLHSSSSGWVCKSWPLVHKGVISHHVTPTELGFISRVDPVLPLFLASQFTAKPSPTD